MQGVRGERELTVVLPAAGRVQRLYGSRAADGVRCVDRDGGAGTTSTPRRSRCTHRTPSAARCSSEPLNPAGGWENDGELTLSAHSLHAEDGDFGQAGTLYREVFDDGAKARLLETLTGAVSGVKNAEIKERAIQYWTNVDAELGAKLRANLGAGQADSDAEAANKG